MCDALKVSGSRGGASVLTSGTGNLTEWTCVSEDQKKAVVYRFLHICIIFPHIVTTGYYKEDESDSLLSQIPIFFHYNKSLNLQVNKYGRII